MSKIHRRVFLLGAFLVAIVFGSTAQAVEFTASITSLPNLKGKGGALAHVFPSSAKHITGNPTAGEEQKGQVYITYSQLGDRKIQVLEPKTSRAMSYFGFSAALHDDLVVIGAPGGGKLRTGASFVYRNNGDLWEEEFVLEPSAGQARDEFGYAVTLRDQEAFVGTPSDDEMIRNGGAVYVFRRDANGYWQEAGKLFPKKFKKVTGFGSSLQSLGKFLIVGAHEPGAYTESLSFVFELREGQWEEVEKFNTTESLIAFINKNIKKATEQAMNISNPHLAAAGQE